MNVGTWNVERGHHPPTVARGVLRQLRDGMEWLALQEAREYLPELRRHLHATEHLAASADGHCALVSARPVVRSWSINLGTWWRKPTGQRVEHPDALAVELEDRIVVVAHLAPGAWMLAPGRGRRFIGAVRRRMAYRRAVLRLARVFRNHPGMPVEVWADWNATPDDRGRWSPDWLRRRVGGRFVRPHRSTGHGEIDYGILRGRPSGGKCWAGGCGHSDHRLVQHRR